MRAYKASNNWSIWDYFCFTLVLRTLRFPKLLPLTIGTGVDLLICILHFFRIISEYAFVITIIPLSFILMSLNCRMKNSSPRSKIWGQEFFIYNNILTPPLESRMLSSFNMWKSHFPFLLLCLKLLSSSISLNPTFLTILISFRYHCLEAYIKP